MQTIEGRNGTRSGNELEDLRKQYDKQMQEDGRLASAFKKERERVQELEAENARLRNGSSGDNGEHESPFADLDANSLILFATGAAFVSLCTFADLKTAKDYEFCYIAGALSRLLGEILFVLWCIAVYRRDGLTGLIKRCSLWTLGWALVLASMYYRHQGMKNLEYRLIDAASPINWWMLGSNASSAEFIIFMFLLILCLDLCSDCMYSRRVFSRLETIGEWVREVLQ